MSYHSELDLALRNKWQSHIEDDVDAVDLQSLAARLGGEVDGQWVRCPSPGEPPDDRSCYVRIDSAGAAYVYDCVGDLSAAYARINKALGIEGKPKRDRSAEIGAILNATLPAAGTHVARYLGHRALTLPIPPCLRFHARLYHKTKDYYPAMVAERRTVTGEIVSVHRTYLAWDRPAKANVDPVRADLGPASGTGIRLSPVAEELMVGEGVETVLSVMQVTGKPGWAAGSAPMLRLLELPPEVRRVLVLADGDVPGDSAANYAALRWKREGREVSIAHAPPGQDFNDVLVRGAQS
jgi:putative DNA primase/helicase